MKPFKSATLIYFVAFIALGLTRAALGATLPGLAEQTQSTFQQISYLFTAHSMGYLLGAYRGGRLYDHLPGHTLNAAALFGMTFLLVLAPDVRLLWLLALVFLLLGMVEASLDVGTNTLIVWLHRLNPGPVLNTLHFFYGAGAFLSPIIVAQALLIGGGLRGAYWGLALLILPIGFLFLRLPNPTPQPSASSGASHPTGKLLVALIFAFSLFYGGAEISFSGWVTIFALSSGLGDAAAAAYLTSGFWGAYTLGRLLSIPLATRVSTRAILIADLCGSVLSLLVILAGASSNLLVWIGVLGLGFSMASVFPTLLAFIGQHLTVSGRTTGYLFVSGSLGGMSLPWLIGQLIESVGARVIPWSVLLALLVSSALLAGILIRAQRDAAASDG